MSSDDRGSEGPGASSIISPASATEATLDASGPQPSSPGRRVIGDSNATNDCQSSPTKVSSSSLTDDDMKRQNTSPTFSVAAQEDQKRKQPRIEERDVLVDGTGDIVATDQDNNNNPLIITGSRKSRGFYVVSDFDQRLRSLDNSQEYNEEEQDQFVAGFSSEVNARFSGRQTSSRKKEINDQTRNAFNSKLLGSTGGGDGEEERAPLFDIRQYSRYQVENIIGCTETTPLVLLVKSSIATERGSQFKNIRRKQKKKFPGTQWGDKWVGKMNGEEYFVLKCQLMGNNDHGSIMNRTVTSEEFYSWFNEGRGFEVHFDGTEEDKRMKFSWKQLVDNPMDFLFFGAPLMDNFFFYDEVFRWKTAANYAHHAFKQLAYECWGDGYASAALLSSYLRDRREKERLQHRAAKTSFFHKNIQPHLNFHGKKASEFFEDVNNVVMERVMVSVTTMQDYTAPIIGQDIISGWITKAMEVFPTLWLILTSLRGINESQSRGSNLIQSKLNQVLFQLFILARMANPKKLIWFAFIRAVASFGRGIPASAVNNFFGDICSNTTRDRLLGGTIRDIMKRQITFLSSLPCLILVFDNYQRGQHLRYQREKHSSEFLKGTTQVALQGWEWSDDAWNDLYTSTVTTINYSNDLVIPSAPNMPRLEDYRGRECELFNSVDTLDVEAQEIPFVDENFKEDKLNEFRHITKSSKARDLFAAAKKFPTAIVKCWNEYWGRKTPSLFLGLVGIADEKSMETGVLAADLLVKSGIIINNGDGKFELAPDYEKKRHIMVGDAKSVENIAKFVREVSGRELSLQESSTTLEVFLRGLAQVMIIPGDWHAGLAMLQAIYTLWWPLLSEFKEHLGWKRITKDVRNCYFNAKRLLEFVADELMRVLLFEFVSEHVDLAEVEDGKEDEFICKVVTNFYVHLKKLAFDEEDDRWRKTWAIFIIMAMDFKSFTEAYRNGDALMVEYGYKKMAPVWECLGQDKYTARHFDQAEVLYGKLFTFARLMECRINRFVRRYDAESKRYCAHDENLENWNGFFARFPKVRTLAAFVRQGMLLGLTRLCAIFVDRFYRVSADDVDESSVPTSSNEAKSKNEKQVIFEVFLKSNTHKHTAGRQVSPSSISSIDVTTNLKEDGKLDKKTKETDNERDLGALDILAAVEEGYQHHINIGQSNNHVEEEDEEVIGTTPGADDADVGDVENGTSGEDAAVDIDWDDDAVATANRENDNNGEKPLYLQNLWKRGNEKFIKRDIGKERKTAADRASIKLQIQQHVYTIAEERRQRTQQIDVGSEANVRETIAKSATQAWLSRKRGGS